MATILWVGGVGSGKTMMAVESAVRLCIEMDGKTLFVMDGLKLKTFELNGVAYLDYWDKDSHPLAVVYWSEWSWLFDNAKCCVVIIDEAGIALNAQEWERLDKKARKKLMEHRKDHLNFVMTAQDISTVEKYFRLLTNEVRLVGEFTAYIRWWRRKRNARPDIWCNHCSGVMRRGDTSYWSAALGCVTYYEWAVYTAAQAIGTVLDPINPPTPVGYGYAWFTQDVAGLYSTVQKVSLSLHKEHEITKMQMPKLKNRL